MRINCFCGAGVSSATVSHDTVIHEGGSATVNKCWVFIVSVAESLSGFIIHVKRIKWFTKSNDQRSFTFKLFRQLWHEAFLPVRIASESEVNVFSSISPRHTLAP